MLCNGNYQKYHKKVQRPSIYKSVIKQPRLNDYYVQREYGFMNLSCSQFRHLLTSLLLGLSTKIYALHD